MPNEKKMSFPNFDTTLQAFFKKKDETYYVPQIIITIIYKVSNAFKANVK